MTVGRKLSALILTLCVTTAHVNAVTAQTANRRPGVNSPSMAGRPGGGPAAQPFRRAAVRQDEMPEGIAPEGAEALDVPAVPQKVPPAAAPMRRYAAPEAPPALHQEVDNFLDGSQREYYPSDMVTSGYGGGYIDGGYGGGFDGGGACCGNGSCGGCGGCGPLGMGLGGLFFGNRCGCGPRLYARAEYLYYWTDGQNLPALVTTSPAGTARADAGVLGLAATTVVFGNQEVGDDGRSGGRGTVGWWITDSLAIEGDYLKLEDAGDTFTQASNLAGQPTIARPFFNAQTNLNNADLVAFNLNGGVFTGNIAIDIKSSFENAGVMLRRTGWTDNYGCRTTSLDYLLGYRYARLNDRINFATSRTTVGAAGAVPGGTMLALTESFESENRYMGADFGVALRSRAGCWTFDFTGKLGFGTVSRRTDINGQTTVTVPNVAPVVTPGGLLAQRSNIGRFRDDEFSFMPDIGVKVGFDVTCRSRVTFGYNFLAMTNVVRAADTIDTTVNTSQVSNQPLVGPSRPTLFLNESDWWAQGLSVGLEAEF